MLGMYFQEEKETECVRCDSVAQAEGPEVNSHNREVVGAIKIFQGAPKDRHLILDNLVVTLHCQSFGPLFVGP